MKFTDIAEGFYYLKKDDASWLRLVVRLEMGRVRWVDFSTPGECDYSTFIRWSDGRRLTADQSRAHSPDDVAKIAATCEKYRTLLGRSVPLVMPLERLEEM